MYDLMAEIRGWGKDGEKVSRRGGVQMAWNGLEKRNGMFGVSLHVTNFLEIYIIWSVYRKLIRVWVPSEHMISHNSRHTRSSSLHVISKMFLVERTLSYPRPNI